MDSKMPVVMPLTVLRGGDGPYCTIELQKMMQHPDDCNVLASSERWLNRHLESEVLSKCFTKGVENPAE
jgi:hypothetical protein